MLRLSFISVAAVFSIVLAACGNANIATGGSGGSTGGGNTGGSHSGGGNTGGGTTSSSTSTGGNTCEQAGGTCVPLTPNPCPNGTIGDASMYSCGGGVGVGCCLQVDCFDSCGTLGTTRCLNGAVETCAMDTVGCHTWQITSACGNGETCNSDGTACVMPATTCSSDAECGCGCGCGGGMCHCTGGLPETCSTDSECGPPCAGFKCTGGKCVAPACTPGQDQTCNHDPAMNAFAGTCLSDGTCSCKQGFVMTSDGKCGPATP